MAKIDKLVAEAKKHLKPDEVVLAEVMGAYESKILGKETLRNGVFLATDRRIFFFGKKLFGFDAESFPYKKISSFEYGKDMMGKTISFFASGNRVKMKWINVGHVKNFVGIVQNKINEKTEVVKTATDVTDQLKKLADLMKDGILTEEEFSAKKKQLLGI